MLFQLEDSLPPKCADGRAPPNCLGDFDRYYSGRGMRANLQTCSCNPICPTGQYWLGPVNRVNNVYRPCGTKAEQDAINAKDKRMYDCMDRGGTWNHSNGLCLGGSSGSGGLNIDSNLIIGGLAVLLLLSVLSK